MMKVCIVGAGAIGGFIGTRLAAAGAVQVSAIARGATLQALRTHGWRMRTATGLVQAPACVSANAIELGPQDLVIIAVKGPALTQVARDIALLLGPQTLVMPAMNGVPWWFCQGVTGLPEGPLETLDPGGEIAAAIPLQQVIACVVHASASTSEPGLVVHSRGQGLILGEPGRGKSARTQRVVDLLAHAGFDATHSADVRYDIWYKLWGNMTMNPVSMLTGALGDRILADPLVRGFCSAVMVEAQSIGARIGCVIEQTPEERHKVTEKLGAFKTSMLQDFDAGRQIELNAILGAVREIGERLDIRTPYIDALFGLTRLSGRVHGLYPQGQGSEPK